MAGKQVSNVATSRAYGGTGTEGPPVDEGVHDIGYYVKQAGNAISNRIIPLEPKTALDLGGKKQPIAKIKSEIETKNLINRGKRYGGV